MKKNAFALIAALAVSASLFGWDPPKHDGAYERDGVSFVQLGGLGQDSYVVTNVTGGGSSLDTNAVERIANQVATTNAVVVAATNGVAMNAEAIAVNAERISTNAGDIATNAAAITTNAANIATNAASIAAESTTRASEDARILREANAYTDEHGGGIDTNAVREIVADAIPTNATIVSHGNAIASNAAEIASIPRIVESWTNPGWAANADSAESAQRADFANMAYKADVADSAYIASFLLGDGAGYSADDIAVIEQAATNAEAKAEANAAAIAAEASARESGDDALQAQIDLFKSFSVYVVDTLPETGEDGCIYLVPIAGTENKAEWLWVHEPSNHWEKIGTTAIDMAEYAKATELSAHAEDRNNPHGVTAEQVGAVALVEDREGGKTAVTIGSRTDEQMASEYKIGARSLSAGLDNVAAGESSVAFGSYCLVFGDNSIATGNGSTAEGINAFASGYYSTAAEDGSVAFAGGRAGGENSFAMGSTVRQGDDYAFTWGTGSYQGDYRSHGPRTFNIDPLGGLDGLWVGETNMAAHIGAAVATTLTNSDATAWAEASATNSIAYLATHAQGGGGLDIRYDAVSNLFYIIVK